MLTSENSKQRSGSSRVFRRLGWEQAALGPVLELRTAPPSPRPPHSGPSPYPPHTKPAALQGGLGLPPAGGWTPGGRQGHGSLWRTHLHYSFLGICGGRQGRWGRSPGTSPHSGHYPPSGLGSMKVRWREIWHEREERKEERDGQGETASTLLVSGLNI